MAQVRPLARQMLLAAAIVGTLVSIAIVANNSFHRDREAARLEALSGLRAGQVESWLREKLAQVQFAGVSPLGELYLRWREGSPQALERMRPRLDVMRSASGGHSVLLLDAQGESLASEPAGSTSSPPALKSAAQQAVRSNAPRTTGFYAEPGSDPPARIDVLSPLYASGTPARGVIALRLDPRDFLVPLLSRWPVPSRTATSSLVRLDGEAIVDVRGAQLAPLAADGPLAAKVLRKEAPLGAAIDGLDFRGRHVLGVVQPVGGTDWYLVAQIDRGEAYADARFDAAWIAVAGLLALLATGFVLNWRHARAEGRRLEANRRELQQQVEQRTRELNAKNEALERTVTDLEAFCASVSHDLRGPLRTVNGFAAILERTEAGKLSQEGQRRLERIRAGASAMDRMLEDMLKCARAERVDLRFAPVNLDSLVHKVVAELEPAYPATRVTVGPLPTVRADATMAGQVFVNLIGNALKFSARKAQPLVEIGTLAGDDGPARIFVRDNGVGFDTGESHKLFEPFQRLHRDEDYEGTGVGLAIVKRVIERHGGSIAAESQPGERTVFTFDFGPALATPG